jgi:tRNA(Arg) A34 adenosine deaminase TadA
MNDETCLYLRQAIALSIRSRKNGNHPFGALLVSDDGRFLLEAENQSRSDNDATGHAERVLLTEASKTLDPAVLQGND